MIFSKFIKNKRLIYSKNQKQLILYSSNTAVATSKPLHNKCITKEPPMPRLKLHQIVLALAVSAALTACGEKTAQTTETP